MEDKCGRAAFSLYQSFRRSEGDSDIIGSVKHSTMARKRSNQIAKELSDMVTYVQVKYSTTQTHLSCFLHKYSRLNHMGRY